MKTSDKTRIVGFYFVTVLLSVSILGSTLYLWVKHINLKNDGIITKGVIIDKNKDPLTHDLYDFSIIYVINNDTIINIFQGEGYEINDSLNVIVNKYNPDIFELTIDGLIKKALLGTGFGILFTIILVIGIVKPKYILKYFKGDIYYGD